MASLDQGLCELIKLLEVVACKVVVCPPVESEPAHRRLDGIHILLVFFGGVGVVEPKVTAAPVGRGQPEVQADGLGMAVVQVAVGLWRKAGDHARHAAAGQVVFDDVLKEILRLGQGGRVGVAGGGHGGFRVNPDFTGANPA